MADPPRVLASLPAADALEVGPGSLKYKSNRVMDSVSGEQCLKRKNYTATMQEVKETIQDTGFGEVYQPKDLVESLQTSRLLMTPVKSNSKT